MNTRAAIFFLILLLSSISANQAFAGFCHFPTERLPDSIAASSRETEEAVSNHETEEAVSSRETVEDSTRYAKRSDNPNWWLNRLKNLDLNTKDTTIIYPKFIKFCVDVYNWGDHFFNPYDPEYVEGTGKRWKARVVNDNWLDSYAMRLPDKMSINMISNPYSNLGGYLQYMAVSVGYTYDMGKVLGNAPLNHKKWEFGFNCARFNVELYHHENEGGTYIRKFGDYKDGRLIKKKFPGVKMRSRDRKSVV